MNLFTLQEGKIQGWNRGSRERRSKIPRMPFKRKQRYKTRTTEESRRGNWSMEKTKELLDIQ